MNIDISISLNALAHPRRVAIFRLLSAKVEGELNFQEIRVATGLRPTSLIHHLREMERAGLLHRYRKGVEACYSLTPGALCASFDAVTKLIDEPGRPELVA